MDCQKVNKELTCLCLLALALELRNADFSVGQRFPLVTLAASDVHVSVLGLQLHGVGVLVPPCVWVSLRYGLTVSA